MCLQLIERLALRGRDRSSRRCQVPALIGRYAVHTTFFEQFIGPFTLLDGEDMLKRGAVQLAETTPAKSIGLLEKSINSNVLILSFICVLFVW